MSSHSDKEKHQQGKHPSDAGSVVDFPGGAGVPDNSAVAGGDPPSAEQFQKLLAEKQELTNTLLRRQADFENYRKRVEKERHQDRHRGAEVLIEQMLPVLDGMDHALDAVQGSANAEYRKGFELIRKQLWDVLSKQGLSKIESLGKEFDPNFHHAIENVETSEHAEGTVVDELQSGYVFHGRVIRPAMVRVAAEPTTARASDRKN